jgi:hypothetical protein
MYALAAVAILSLCYSERATFPPPPPAAPQPLETRLMSNLAPEWGERSRSSRGTRRKFNDEWEQGMRGETDAQLAKEKITPDLFAESG